MAGQAPRRDLVSLWPMPLTDLLHVGDVAAILSEKGHGMSDVVRIEQRLQEPPQFFFFPADEAIAIGVPVVLGLLSKHLFLGVALGVIFFMAWKRVKRGGGLPHVLGLLYWILPAPITVYRSLPDSGVMMWRA